MDGQLFKLVINNPCSQNWDIMLPTEMGRYCLSCKKVVIDFSSMADKDVADFFLNNHNQPVCGRFRKEQLDSIWIYLPENIFQTRIARWKKFLVVLLICFGISLFSIEVVFGNAPFQNEQNQQPKKIQRKSTESFKKVKNKIPKIEFKPIVFDGKEIVAGFTQSIPCGPLQPQWVDIILPDTLPKIEKDKKMEMNNSTVSTDLNSKNKGDQPKEKKPKEKFEFILPAPLRIRRRLLKK